MHGTETEAGHRQAGLAEGLRRHGAHDQQPAEQRRQGQGQAAVRVGLQLNLGVQQVLPAAAGGQGQGDAARRLGVVQRHQGLRGAERAAQHHGVVAQVQRGFQRATAQHRRAGGAGPAGAGSRRAAPGRAGRPRRPRGRWRGCRGRRRRPRPPRRRSRRWARRGRRPGTARPGAGAAWPRRAWPGPPAASVCGSPCTPKWCSARAWSWVDSRFMLACSMAAG
jgi:hypothetical protein